MSDSVSVDKVISPWLVLFCGQGGSQVIQFGIHSPPKLNYIEQRTSYKMWDLSTRGAPIHQPGYYSQQLHNGLNGATVINILAMPVLLLLVIIICHHMDSSRRNLSACTRSWGMMNGKGSLVVTPTSICTFI